MSWVAHYFSNYFQKLTGNEYCSKLEKEFRFKVMQTLNISYKSFLWIFEFKNILKLLPELIQNSGIFRTRDILRTVSIYPMKI